MEGDNLLFISTKVEKKRRLPSFINVIHIHEILRRWGDLVIVILLFTSGTTGERIVLVGDSAGGNFAFGVSMKLKELGIRMPDSIVSIYPNVNASTSATPSRISALWDPILPLGVMLACQAVCSFLQMYLYSANVC